MVKITKKSLEKKQISVRHERKQMQHKEITFNVYVKIIYREKRKRRCVCEKQHLNLMKKKQSNVFPAKGKNSIVRERIMFYLFGLKVAYNTYTDIQRSCVKRFSSIDS